MHIAQAMLMETKRIDQILEILNGGERNAHTMALRARCDLRSVTARLNALPSLLISCNEDEQSCIAQCKAASIGS